MLTVRKVSSDSPRDDASQFLEVAALHSRFIQISRGRPASR